MTHEGEEENGQPAVPREQRPGLTREEDDELRRLAFMARYGKLRREAQERLAELRSRDRRKEIRLPREWEPGPSTTEAVRRVIPRSQRPPDNGPPRGADGL